MGGHTIGSRVTMLGGRLPCRVDGSRKGGAILLICFPLDVQKKINLSFLFTAAPRTLAKFKKIHFGSFLCQHNDNVWGQNPEYQNQPFGAFEFKLFWSLPRA